MTRLPSVNIEQLCALMDRLDACAAAWFDKDSVFPMEQLQADKERLARALHPRGWMHTAERGRERKRRVR